MSESGIAGAHRRCLNIAAGELRAGSGLPREEETNPSPWPGLWSSFWGGGGSLSFSVTFPVLLLRSSAQPAFPGRAVAVAGRW